MHDFRAIFLPKVTPPPPQRGLSAIAELLVIYIDTVFASQYYNAIWND